MATAQPIDPTLAREYPKVLRDAYRGLVRRTSAADRHQRLLRLGELSLAHLTSLAFADYRRAKADAPDPSVEKFLAENPRFTLGHHLALFRATQKALGRSEIFGIQRYEVNVQLDNARRWISAVRAIEYARTVGATDIARVIEDGVQRPTKAVRWLAFWEEFVAYRNRIAHADAHRWPVDARGYYEAMTGPLENALVEALRTEYIDFVLLEYPVFQLVDIRRSRTGWVQRFDGEYHGVPLLEEVDRPAPPAPWESDIGCDYVVQHTPTGWAPHSRFFDLLLGPPPPIAVIASGAASDEGQEHAAPGERAPMHESATPTIRHQNGIGTEPVRPTSSPANLGGLRHQDHEAPPERPSQEPTQTHHDEPAQTSQLEPPARTASESGPEASPEQTLVPPEGRRAATKPDGKTRVVYRPSFSLWMLWGILSLGLLAGVGFLWAGSRKADVRLRVAGMVYVILNALTLTCIIIAGNDTPPHGFRAVVNVIAVCLFVGTWLGSTVHAIFFTSRQQAPQN